MHPAWAQGLRDQCAEAGVPFFFKQWGEWAPRDHKIHGASPKQPVVRLGEHGRSTSDLVNNTCDMGSEVYMQRVGRKAAGRLLDEVKWNQFPEVTK
jgi:hypothetical protein